MTCWRCHSNSVNTGSSLPSISDVKTRKRWNVVEIDMIRNNRIVCIMSRQLCKLYHYSTLGILLWYSLHKWLEMIQKQLYQHKMFIMCTKLFCVRIITTVDVYNNVKNMILFLYFSREPFIISRLLLLWL